MSHNPKVPHPGKYDPKNMSEPERSEYWGKWNRHHNSHAYHAACFSCGSTLEVQTQSDECPEYYADVYVKCTCGEFVKFKLPVN